MRIGDDAEVEDRAVHPQDTHGVVLYMGRHKYHCCFRKEMCFSADRKFDLAAEIIGIFGIGREKADEFVRVIANMLGKIGSLSGTAEYHAVFI